MTAREKVLAMTSDPLWQEKYRLAAEIARELKAREAERENARLRRRLERLQARQEAHAGA